jgi:predicted phage tail protein
MQTVYLNGGIAQFGEKWNTNCNTIRDIFKLIECQTPGFRNYLIQAYESGVGFDIKRGSEFLQEPEELLLSLNNEDIIITEVPAGSKSGGAKILAAIVLAVATAGASSFLTGLGDLAVYTAGSAEAGAAYYAAAATVAKVGTALAINLGLNGVTQLLAPGPETEPDSRESYLFNGPANTVAQGIPIPILYGELVVGGAPISTYYSSSPIYPQAEIQLGEFTFPITGSSGLASAQSYEQAQLISFFISPEEIEKIGAQVIG